MANEKEDIFNDREKDTTATGRNLPSGDGTGKPTGQDHSTED